MNEEKNRLNCCKIYSIYFKNMDQQYEIGESKGKSNIVLQKIAEIGGTQHYYTPRNLHELCDTFKTISDAIQTNYKLKLNSK